MARPGVFGTPVDDYSFSIRGRYVLVNAVDTATPSPIQPIDVSVTIPSGWTYLGACENGEVGISVTRSTTAINTGAIPVERRRVITGQSGSIDTLLQMPEPIIVGLATGSGTPLTTASTSLNRAIVSLWHGGQLGGKKSVLIVQDWDIPLISNDGLTTYDQKWFYTPRAEAAEDINLSEAVERVEATRLRMVLYGFTNVSAGDRDVLLLEQWLKAA
jgi:hypothetical protein